MILQTFEQHVSDKALIKGQAYFENGHITDLEEWEAGKWTAVVSGSEDYVVNIQLKNGNTYSAKEWPEIAEGFIKELQRKNKAIARFDGIINPHNLADVFIEEAYWHRLLELCQKNCHLEFVENYYEHLKDKFPEELLSIYKEALIEYAAQNTGRNFYITIRNVLKRMQGWKGGRNVVKQLIEQFIKQYKARKAMIEELEKLVR